MIYPIGTADPFFIFVERSKDSQGKGGEARAGTDVTQNKDGRQSGRLKIGCIGLQGRLNEQ